MAIQNRRGNFVDFDPYKMLAGEFAYALDTEELYYCVAPGNVKRCATKEDIIEILETNQEAYDGLQQLLTELESETVLTGMLADISQLLNDVAINKANIGDLVNYVGDLTTLTTVEKSNIVGALNEIDAKHKSHLAEYASLFTDNPDAKNSIYRGKYLGNSVTSQQYTAISSGTFTDLYIGDYWTINGINWRIAAFNYYRNTGDSLVPGNHITIAPDTNLYTHGMNDTNITTGGYTGSKMYTTGLGQAKTTIKGIFGAHLIKHRQILSNATVDGKASGWAWIDSEVGLMSEPMVYGSIIWGESSAGGSGYNIGVGKSQLPLFRLNPRMINTRQSYWLRDVVSAADFALVSNHGIASAGSASSAAGVRPAFSIS